MTSLAATAPAAPLQILVPQFLCFALNNTSNNVSVPYVQPDLGKVEKDLKKRNRQLARKVEELTQRLDTSTQQNLRLQRHGYILYNNLTRCLHEQQEIKDKLTDIFPGQENENIVIVIDKLYIERDTCKDNLNTTEHILTEKETKLNETLVTYEETKNNLTSTIQDLDKITTNLENTQGELNNTKKDLEVASTQYKTTKDKLDKTEIDLKETTEKFNLTDDVVDILVPDRSELLTEAAATGNISLLRPLVLLGTPLSKPDQFGFLALDWASLGGDVGIIKLLVHGGANVNGRLKEYDDAPLHVTARAGFADVVRLLLGASADKNTKNVYGNTALHEASYYGHEEVVKALLDGGATVDEKNNDGATPLMFAAEKGHLPVVKLLVAKGANTSLKNEFGRTPEEEAYHRGKHNVAFWLGKRL